MTLVCQINIIRQNLTYGRYAMGAVRLSAISDFGVLYIMTHDSIGLGEDGPTHQPIESLQMLRALPGINVLRPGDGKFSRNFIKFKSHMIYIPIFYENFDLCHFDSMSSSDTCQVTRLPELTPLP